MNTSTDKRNPIVLDLSVKKDTLLTRKQVDFIYLTFSVYEDIEFDPDIETMNRIANILEEMLGDDLGDFT